MNIKKYFWSLNPKALKEVKSILGNPRHPKFIERAFTLLSRCDNPREVFALIGRKQFVEAWPRLRRFWIRTNQAVDFRNWWETIYEQLAKKQRIKGRPSEAFLKIGAIIREKRLKRRIGQLDFSRQVGISQPDISAIESGKKNITLETLTRLCKTLGIKNLPFS